MIALTMASGCISGVSYTGNTGDIMPGGTAPPMVRIPNAVHAGWHGFTTDLDPTVMLWARQAHIDLDSVVRNALKKIEDALHGSPVRITIEAGTYYTIPDIGIGGYTSPETGEVQISMSSSGPVGLRALLTEWIPRTMAHELHHSARITRGPGYGTTLLDAMITEGSAMAFAAAEYPGNPVVPWQTPLPPSLAASTWKKATSELRNPETAESHQRWFFGTDGVPRWAGYKLGYAIVESYLKRYPSVSPAGLVKVTSSEIFGGSSYTTR